MSNLSTKEHYSAPVQEILGFVPNWIVRWGISMIFILLVILISIAWIIKYPDLIVGDISLSTKSPMIEVNSKTNGVLTKIIKAEGTYVVKDEPIAEIRSTLNKEAFAYLKKLLTLDLKDFNPALLKTNITFGAIQEEYNRLLESISTLNSQFEKEIFIVKKSSLLAQITNSEGLILITKKKIELAEKELRIAQEIFLIRKQLYEEGVMAKLDFLNEKSLFNQKEKEVQNLKTTLLQNDMTLKNTKSRLLELQYEHAEAARKTQEKIITSTKNIEKYLKDWQEQYIIEAPINGTLIFTEEIHENQFLNSNQFPFAIIPDDENYIGIVSIKVHNSGKVKIGQKVNIELFDYPSVEFGKLSGTVEDISSIPNENIYSLEIKLPKELITSYNYRVKYKPRMKGVAEIITDDLRLMERIFFKINSFFKDSF